MIKDSYINIFDKSIVNRYKIDGKERFVFFDDSIIDKIIFKYISSNYIQIKVPKWFENPNEFLRLIDLNGIEWKNVDVRGIDFKGTNARVNPRLVFGRSIENTNFEGINLSVYSFRGVNINGANLKDSGAHIYCSKKKLDSLDLSLLDGCYINGNLFTYEENNIKKRIRRP